MRFLAAFLTALLLSNAADARPNFIVFLIDDQEDTGSMGYMPQTISLLADHGLTFTNSFVNYPVCAPSRSSFLTGQAAHNHGVQSNNPGGRAAGWTFKEKEENTLPVWLKAAGYKTALLGKYVNGYGKKEKDKRSEKKRPDSFHAGAPWRSALLLETKAGFAVRTATRKYVEYNGGAEELYDLAADPHELENRTVDADYESDLSSLRSSLGRLKECSGASCWVPSPGIAMALSGRPPSLYQYSELAPEW